MSDGLKRSLAPMSAAAWKAVEEQARETLSGNLSARRVLGVVGPLGWEHAAVNLGRVRACQVAGDVACAVRESLPLVEARVDFSIEVGECEAIDRGARDADLSPVADAAHRLAAFEDNLVYHGFKEAGMTGMTGPSDALRQSLPDKADAVVPALEAAVVQLQKTGIGGPYHLVLDTKRYALLAAGAAGCQSLSARVREITEGRIFWSPSVRKGVLVSGRGGDYELTLGADASIGYQAHNAKKINLFLVETLAFRVLEPRACVTLV